MRVRDLLDVPGLGLRLLTEVAGMDRTIRHVYTYEGIIPAEIIDRVAAPDGGARVRQTFLTRPWQRMIVAIAAGQGRDRPTSPAWSDTRRPARRGMC